MSSGSGQVNGRPHQTGEIWNQFTYSSEHFRLFTRMRMVEKRSAMLGGPPSEYLERMGKVHANKLKNEVNEEKNKVKAKKELLA